MRLLRLKSTWAFQVGSSRSVAASPSKFSGDVGLITSHFKSTWEVVLTSNLALSCFLKRGYQWAQANKAICKVFKIKYKIKYKIKNIYI